MRLLTCFLTIGILYTGLCMCLRTPDPFEVTLRHSSEESKVDFYLYTRSGQEEIITFDKNTLLNSKFDSKKDTKIIIHGFFDNKKSRMTTNMKNRYLEVDDVNVIIVDWGKIADKMNYFWIAKQTSVVGRLLAEFIQCLIINGTSEKNIHLIGHSLGAHVAGFAGATLRRIYGEERKISRITGLDPAKPLFNNKDESHKLDKSDADFVDCIHTCGGLLGIYEPLGHVDFYPNGGKNIQPGCSFLDFGKCSHSRSHEYFEESILPNHIFPAYKCTANGCVETNERMGNPVNKTARGILFAKTNRRAPFAPEII